MRGARPQADLEQHIARDGVIRKGERVLAACSGGPDSVALAAALHAVAVPMDLQLTLGYVHHGTRDSAWQDECVVLRLAAAIGCSIRVAALAPDARDEAALRDARYAALLDMAQSSGASVIATGHHADDQSESVLLALFRGAGSDGLAGIRPRRELAHGIDLARPLLRFTSQRLLEYCALQGLPYAVDPSNAQPDVRRNSVRAALATLRPLFPGLDAAVARAAETVGDERDGTARARLRRRVREALRSRLSLRDIEFTHFEAAVRTLERGGSGRFFMKSGVTLCIEGSSLRVIIEEDECR